MQAKNALVARRNLDDQLAGLEGERPPMHGRTGSAGRLVMGTKRGSSPSWSALRERRTGLSAKPMQARNALVARRNLDDQLAGLEGERPPMHGRAGSAGR
jgi:hypothetical protein